MAINVCRLPGSTSHLPSCSLSPAPRTTVPCWPICFKGNLPQVPQQVLERIPVPAPEAEGPRYLPAHAPELERGGHGAPGQGYQGLSLHHAAASHTQEQVGSLTVRRAGREASRRQPQGESRQLSPYTGRDENYHLGNLHPSRALGLSGCGALGCFSISLEHLGDEGSLAGSQSRTSSGHLREVPGRSF